MSNYIESKKKLDAIRNEYSSAGDVIFRSAIHVLINTGKDYLSDGSSYEHMINFTDNELDRIVLQCAHELAAIDIGDLLIYIQKEIYVGCDGGMSYQKMRRRLIDCIYWITDGIETSDSIADLMGIGFSKDELKEFGYEYLFDADDE